MLRSVTRRVGGVLLRSAHPVRFLASFFFFHSPTWSRGIQEIAMVTWLTSRRRCVRPACILALTVLALSVTPRPAAAQGNTGQISGRVTDDSGGVLPGVTVTATHTSTGLVRTATTNEAGQYTLAALPVGAYRVDVVLQGFRSFARENITLQVNASLVIDPVLQVGQVAETVTVVAQSSEVDVEMRGVGVGTVVEQERILELPIAGRQVNDLITLSGAAVQVDQSPSWGMATGVNISVAGASRFGVAYMLDGATNTNRFDQTGMPTPFPDALQEFRISTSTQEASTGRASGASVNAVTRSGTNQFSGNLFWFGRDARFNARRADAAPTQKNDGLRRHQPGGSFGGPIVQNRIFFFAGYQSTVLHQEPTDTLSVVPTQAMLNGDWSAFNRCFNPAWRDADFADGFVDPSRYNSAARALAARLPTAQNECGEIRWGTPVERHDKQTVARIDYQHSESQSFFGRYMATLQDQDVQFQEENLLTASAGAAGFHDKAHSLVIGHTWVLGPTALASTRVAYNRITVNKLGSRFFNPEDVGIDQWTSVPNHFILTVQNAFSIGSGPTALRQMWQDQFQIGSDISKTMGNHQFTVGGQWERAQVTSVAHTRGVGGITVNSTFTGNAIGDFMLGRLSDIRQAMPTTLSPYQNYVSLYAQDDWRIAPNLTFNYGLRWEPYIPMVWRDDPPGSGIRMYNFSVDAFKAGQKSVVFPNAPAGFTYPSQSPDGSGPADFEGAAAVPARWNKLAPRVGVSWDPTGSGRTSVRAGYGIANDLVELQALLNATNVSPWVGDTIYRNGTLDQPWAGLPGGNPFPFDWHTDPKFISDSVFIPFGADLDTARVQNWNVGVQQQFAGRWLGSVSYIGNHTTGLWNTTAVNGSVLLTPSSHPGLFTGADTCVLEGVAYTPCNQVANINQRRELRLWAAENNPALLADARLFTNIDEYRSDSTSDYHGMLTSLRGDLGLMNLNANYTLSKCMTDRTNVGVSNPNQTFHRGRDRQHCASDRRHLFNLTAVFNAPELSGGTLGMLASNWRVATIYRFTSGAPHSIVSGADRALSGLAGQTVDQVSEDVYQDTSGELGSQYLNRDAFAIPALGTYGNTDFNAFRGPSFWTFDVALSRIFDIVATHRVELRVEAFNVLNTVQPNDQNVAAMFNLSSPNFGRITSVRDPRIFQFAVKYIF
jgi:hypothetical protein